MGKKSIKKLAYEIADLLENHECQEDVYIYFNNKRIKFNNGKWLEEDGYSPADYFEYYNLDTISMSFEGNFYEVINYGMLNSLLDKFNSLIESYGYYYELGNAWNLALYE